MKEFTIALTEILRSSVTHRTRAGVVLALMLSMQLVACSTSPQGRSRIATPAPLGNIYSEVDMRINLATVAAGSVPCHGNECMLNAGFDEKVHSLGTRLTQSAFDSYPELSDRVKRFEFVIAEKEALGSASNATGTIVIFRGAQKSILDEKTLAFMLAREMGHVIGRHHDENAAPRVMLSVLTAVIFPAITIFRNSAAVANAATATSVTSTTTAATAAASTATSYLGSKMILASIKPDQLREADVIALKLLEGLGWDGKEIANSLESEILVTGVDTWSKDFHISVAHVKALEEELLMAESTPGAQSIDSQEPQISIAVSDESQPEESTLPPLMEEKIELALTSEPATQETEENAPTETVEDLPTIIAEAPVNIIENHPVTTMNEMPLAQTTARMVTPTRSQLRVVKAPKIRAAQRIGKKTSIARGKGKKRVDLAQVTKDTKTTSRDYGIRRKVSPSNIVKVSKTSTLRDKTKQPQRHLNAVKIPKKLVVEQKTIKMAGIRQWRNSVPRE